MNKVIAVLLAILLLVLFFTYFIGEGDENSENIRNLARVEIEDCTDYEYACFGSGRALIEKNDTDEYYSNISTNDILSYGFVEDDDHGGRRFYLITVHFDAPYSNEEYEKYTDLLLSGDLME